jgi:2-phospho-L-lactate transferase/gluconeogenesis factor (CofD/UPF0052 family)
MLGPDPSSHRDRKLQIVIFSGGRGSSVLSKELLADSRIDLTLAINGYDDGLSTGEIRRFLGEALGPSDFRKNANRMAGELNTCPQDLLEILETRFPEETDRTQATRLLKELPFRLCRASFDALTPLIRAFESELERSAREFKFGDCSVGNIAFAGCYLVAGRDFNRAVDRYAAMLGLPAGLIENVTDGANAYLVAMDQQNQVLADEADIVDTKRRNRIAELFLVSERPSKEDVARLNNAGAEAVRLHFAERSVTPAPNQALLEKLRTADIIVYAPGTQHSSLFPSYLTPGVGPAIAHNLRAFKILITNLQGDADLAESSAVEIIERAVYYLREKGRLLLATPCLITHYLINDPKHSEERDVYLPLGLVDTLEDPRLVRIGNYEDGVTGRHDASKLLQPFVRSFLNDRRLQVGIVLQGAASINKISQTLIEMVRSNFGELDVDATVYYESSDSLPSDFLACLPFQVRNVWGRSAAEDPWDTFDSKSYDYMVLFESSGMYKGEDVILLVAQLMSGQLDAVWGSRRLSITDIHHAYRMLHHSSPVRGAISYLGSHMLSLACLALYGRYVSDTLSGVRAIRASLLRQHGLDPKDSNVNFQMLSILLRSEAEVIETPVRYFPISPQKVKRTSVLEGITALCTLIRGRFKHRVPPEARAAETIAETFAPVATKLRRSSAAR